MKAICNKGICVFLFLSLLMSATMVNAQRVITASGKYITKNIKVTRFDQIYLKVPRLNIRSPREHPKYKLQDRIIWSIWWSAV